MIHSQMFHSLVGYRHLPPKHWKLAGLFACGVFGCRFIIRSAKKYNRQKKIKRKQEEVKESIARLRQQLQNDGMTAEKSERITKLNIIELQAKLQNGQLKAIDVLKAYQYKALDVNDRTNCIVEPIKEAEALARELDNDNGTKGPLHGIPVSLKESYYIKGYDVTAGMSYFIGKPVSDDAVLVKAIKAAGGVPFVRTNIPQTVMTFDCSNPIYGVTTNPYDSKRSPGGSSGGEAAIISSGGSILGFASDIGGSIRIPCNMCGVVGLKPTVQRLSYGGMFKLNTGQRNVPAASGPMAQTVDGVVLAMKVLLDKTMFELDPFIPPLSFNNQMYESKKPLRIGYYTYDGIINPVPACVRAVNEAKVILEKLGHTVVPFSPPDVYKALSTLLSRSIVSDGGDELATYLRDDEIDPSYFLFYHTYQTLPVIVRKIVGLLIRLKDKFAGDIVLSDRVVFKVDWWNLYDKISAYKCMFIKELKKQELDAILCPGFGCTALPTYKSLEVPTVLSYTTLWNLLNFPAGSIPVTKVTQQDQQDLNNEDIYPAERFFEKQLRKLCGDGEGLPVNVQCVALPFQEELVLRLMKEIESNIN